MVTHVKNKVIHGHIEPCWDEYKLVEWINEPFNDADTLAKWQEIGHNYEKYTGQLHDQRFVMPSWVSTLTEKLADKWPTPAINPGIAIYCMKPGTILPNHSDTYNRYKKIHDITDSTKIYRMLILMENWKSGHYLEVDGVPYTNWQAGDFVIWQNDTVHMAANIGNEDRYTLQVTATL